MKLKKNWTNEKLTLHSIALTQTKKYYKIIHSGNIFWLKLRGICRQDSRRDMARYL